MNPSFPRRGAGAAGNASARTASVAAGSVWETRMINDQVMGGIKLYAAGDAEKSKREEEEEDADVRSVGGDHLLRPASAGGTASERRKRRSWLPPDQEGRTLSEILRGAPVPAEGDASTAEKEFDTTRRKTWVVEEIKQVDREVPACPSVESRPVPSPEPAMEPPSVRPARQEIAKKSTATVQLPEKEELFYDSISAGKSDMIQCIVDVLMWADVAKSALVFGVGAFLIFCSSYATEFDFSLLSGASFIGLLNLAVVFIYKSVIHRGLDHDDGSDQGWWIGEEEAVRLTKAALPYMNKLLSKLRTWFSGDPATTMKLAVTLFILAKYGGQITVWTMTKMAFFGAFTIPRLCLSRSNPMPACAKPWLDKLRRVWNSSTYKKAAFAVLLFILWNLSSVAVRIWVGFMLVVAVRYYQQQHHHRRVGKHLSSWEGDQVAIKKQQLAHQRPPVKVAASPSQSLAEAAATGHHRPRRHGPPSSSSPRLVEAASARITRKRV